MKGKLILRKERIWSLFLVITMLFTLFTMANPAVQAATTTTYAVTKDTYVNGGTDNSNDPNMFIATTTGRTSANVGDPITAPKILNETYNGSGNPMGSSRIAFVQYTIPGNISVSDVVYAKMKMYVTGANGNLAAGYVKVAAYAVQGTTWNEGLTNATITASSDISDTTLRPSSYTAPTAWSDKKITYSGSTSDPNIITSGWITFDITDYVKSQLTANASGTNASTLDLAFRLQVPNGGVYIAANGTGYNPNPNASYIEMVTAPRATVTVNYLNTNGDAIRTADSSVQEVGTSYTFTNNNQTIIANNKIYSCNPTASDSTTVTVASGGNTINLRYDEVTISSYTQPQDGTASNTLPEKLPSTLNVTLSDGTSAVLPVTWNLNAADFAHAGTVTVAGYVTGATNAAVNASVAVGAAVSYIATKDTYLHPTSGTAIDGGPGTTELPTTNTAANKGISKFMIIATDGTTIAYLGQSDGNTLYKTTSSNWGSARNALVQYSIPVGTTASSILSAKVNLTVNKLNNLVTGDWMKASIYPVTDTTWDEYTVTGPDVTTTGDLIALSNKLDFAYVTGNCDLPLTFDITDYIKAQLTADPTKTDFAFRIKVPIAGLWVFSREYGSKQPALTVVYNNAADINVKYVDADTNTELQVQTIDAGVIGSPYTYTKTPVKNISYNGNNYIYDVTASSLSIGGVSATSSENVIVLKYRKDVSNSSILIHQANIAASASGGYDVNLNVSNDAGTDKSATVIVAAFKATGGINELVGVNKSVVTIPATASNTPLTVNIADPRISGTDTIKAFIWSDMNSITPFVQILNITN